MHHTFIAWRRTNQATPNANQSIRNLTQMSQNDTLDPAKLAKLNISAILCDAAYPDPDIRREYRYTTHLHAGPPKPTIMELRKLHASQRLQLASLYDDNIVQLYRNLPIGGDVPAWFDLVTYCKSVNMSDVSDANVHATMVQAAYYRHGLFASLCHHSCWETKLEAGLHQVNQGEGCIHTILADLPDGYELKVKIGNGNTLPCSHLSDNENSTNPWLCLAKFVNKQAVLDPPLFCWLGKYHCIRLDLPVEFKVRYSFLPFKLEKFVDERKYLVVDYPVANITMQYADSLIYIYQRFGRYATNPQTDLSGGSLSQPVKFVKYTDHAGAHHAGHAQHADHAHHVVHADHADHADHAEHVKHAENADHAKHVEHAENADH
jgi:hypothetical protein